MRANETVTIPRPPPNVVAVVDARGVCVPLSRVLLTDAPIGREVLKLLDEATERAQSSSAVANAKIEDLERQNERVRQALGDHERDRQSLERIEAELNERAVEVLLRVERHDGNDPIEAGVRLPCVPRKGELIEVWNSRGGVLNLDRAGDLVPSGESTWLEVDSVVYCAYAPEHIEVWVRAEGYDMAEVERTMEAADRGEQP